MPRYDYYEFLDGPLHGCCVEVYLGADPPDTIRITRPGRTDLTEALWVYSRCDHRAYRLTRCNIEGRPVRADGQRVSIPSASSASAAVDPPQTVTPSIP